MAELFLLVGLVAFILTLKWVGIVPLMSQRARAAVATGRLLRSPDVADVEKEAAARTTALLMIRTAFDILWRTVCATSAAAICVGAGVLFGLFTVAEAATVAVDPTFLGSTLAGGVVLALIFR